MQPASEFLPIARSLAESKATVPLSHSVVAIAPISLLQKPHPGRAFTAVLRRLAESLRRTKLAAEVPRLERIAVGVWLEPRYLISLKLTGELAFVLMFEQIVIDSAISRIL